MGINGASDAATLLAVPIPSPVPPEQAASNRKLIGAVKAVNEAGMFGDNEEITFHIDRNSRLPVICIIDRATNKVVNQIPTEYILQLAESLGKGRSSNLSSLG